MVEKRFLVLFVLCAGIALLASAFAFPVDPGPVPELGHALAAIQGYFQGDASLLESLGKVQQRVSGTCDSGQGFQVVKVEGSVDCEMDLQRRITGQCPSNAIRVINANGTVGCETESAMGVIASSCPPGELAVAVAANGAITCAEPTGVLCEYQNTGRMYTEGARCNPNSICSTAGGNDECICSGSGNFACNSSGTYPCPTSC